MELTVVADYIFSTEEYLLSIENTGYIAKVSRHDLVRNRITPTMIIQKQIDTDYAHQTSIENEMDW